MKLLLLVLAFASFALVGCAHNKGEVPNDCTIMRDTKHKVVLVVCEDKDTIVEEEISY